MTTMWFRPSDLPDGWHSVPIRRIGRVLNGGTPTADPSNWGGEIPFVTPPDLNGVDGAVLKSTGRTLSKSGAEGAGLSPAGSVLVSTRAPIGHVGRVAEKSAFNQGCRAVAPQEGADPRYVAAVLVAARAELMARGQGTTFFELSSSAFASISTPLPPLDEQSAIADYLDQETAQIDALVAKQEEFIGLLRERRSGLIAAGVTGRKFGEEVDNDASWLGTPPAGWLLGQIKHFGAVTLGKMLQSNGDGDDIFAPYMRAANVQPDGVLALEDVKSMWFNRREFRSLDLRSGDVVVVEGGIGGYGRAAFIAESLEGWGFQNSINRIRPFNDNDGRYLAYFLIMARQRGFITAYCNIVSMPHLTSEKLAVMPMFLPPPDEQREIANRIDDQTSRIDTLITKAEEHIALAKERRAALITAAVTGQFDVRTARKAG